jgi:hypothetical protein
MITEPKIQCAHSEVWELARFKPHPRNVNTHPEEQLRLLGKVIVASGWRSPICVSKRSGLVIKGHGRLVAAKLAGLTVAPVDLQDYADEAAKMADLIADNRLSALAEIDMTALKDVLENITESGVEIELTGFTTMELERVMSVMQVEGENNVDEVWAGMPECANEDKLAKNRLLINFKSDADKLEFAKTLGQALTEKTKSVWFPAQPAESKAHMRYTDAKTPAADES